MHHVRLSVVLASIAAGGGSALALPDFNPPTASDAGRGTKCPDLGTQVQVELPGAPFVVGYPIVGFSVKLSAERMHFVGHRSACEGPDVVAPIPAVHWYVTARPLGSAAALDDFTSLGPLLPLDVQGTYALELVVCPGGCVIRPTDLHADPIAVEERHLTLTFEAFPSAPLGPETQPEVVPSASAPRSEPLPDQCGAVAGLLAAQWWAVRQIHGPEDYRLLEGFVRHSRVSRKDSPTNHDSQDTNYHVRPDPKYLGLLFPDEDASEESGLIEVEWERDSVPERFRPTAGDRVSLFGYWIRDCAHGRPEIHPPVGLAVQRPRPIRIPDGTPFTDLGGRSAGDGLYVPGIITELWFSDSGGALVDCGGPGLVNAERVQTPTGPRTACVPRPSLQRVFEFDVFLPRNPQVTMQRAGLLAPPVPLYVADAPVEPAGAHPAPDIEQRTTAGGITYLHVRLDLRGYDAPTYAHRIVAGWVLPSPDNWGLASWRLRLERLHVFEDGEADGASPFGFVSRPGQWRLWVNTNNARSDTFSTQEWVKILDRDVYGEDPLHDGEIAFGPDHPWETGALRVDRSLGPDLLRYPAREPGHETIPGPLDYGILFHTTGYESDTFASDDAGTIFTSAKPGPPEVLFNECESSDQFAGLLTSGCVWYGAEFDVRPGPPLAPPVLSADGKRLHDLYVLRCPVAPGGQVGVCEGLVAEPTRPPPVSPADEVLDPDAVPIDLTEALPFSGGEREGGLTDAGVAEFYRAFAGARRADPAAVRRGLADLRAALDRALDDPALAREALWDARVIRAALPADLWARHFGDLPRPRPDPRTSRARFKGAASLRAGGGEVALRALSLPCDAERGPGSLTVEWRGHRFDLDLVLRGACTAGLPGAPAASRLRGSGVGRLDGVPGAVAQWDLADAGTPRGRDGVVITVWPDEDARPVLEGTGPVIRGNLAAIPDPRDRCRERGRGHHDCQDRDEDDDDEHHDRD